MLLKDSCSKEPQAAITWLSSPEEAYKLLFQRYSYSAEMQRDSLYSSFHSLRFQSYSGSLEAFNSEFNNYLARLRLIRVVIELTDQINQYLNAVKSVFPQWAERQRSTIRQSKALGISIDALNLQFLIADLLIELRDKSSLAAKASTYKT